MKRPAIILLIFSFSFISFYCNAVEGTVCLRPKSYCPIVGSLWFSYSSPIMASPYVMNCGPHDGRPKVKLLNRDLYGTACAFQEVIDTGSRVMSSGYFGAYVEWSWEYGIIKWKGVPLLIVESISEYRYVNCWKQLC